MNTSLKLIALVSVLLGLVAPLRAQEPTAPKAFTNDRLEQMAAPIALYPDALVAQILMASTYPLEVVEAARWVEKNPGLQGQALQDALKTQEWDPSVKALCGFPTVLKQMNDNVEWTHDLGDAFLGQKTELMDTIQTMRRKAIDAGNLKTTEQQQVIQESDAVVIQPTNPEVIYVPSYSPVVVYGPSWYYPTWYYPGWYVAPAWGFGFVSFGIGFFWGFGLWGSCNWHNHCCNINCNQFNHFNSCTSFHAVHSNFPTRAGTMATWQHDPVHRAGVNYRSPQVAHQFGAAPGYSRITTAQARGSEPISPLSGSRGSGLASRSPAITRPSESVNRASGAISDRGYNDPSAQRYGVGPASGRISISREQARGYDRATIPSTSSFSTQRSTSPSYRSGARYYSAPSRTWGSRESAISGVRSPSFDRSASTRGAMSRGSSSSFGGSGRSAGSFGGGARGGAGSRGGGHR
jgi:uncharacterized membrane protein YgcG